MTLPDPEVLKLLQRDFVVGWQNIEREDYCGLSHGYSPLQTAVGTSNGAGGHNVQLLVLSPDLVVLHALPGFWHPVDLVDELRFALVLDRLWRDDSRDRAAKEAMCRRLQEHKARDLSEAAKGRSGWQSFDRRAELDRRQAHEPRDTVLPEKRLGQHRMKPIAVLVHERMARQPFVPLDRFDLDALVDYGRRYYDNNAMYDEPGKRFALAEHLQAHRERQQRLAELRQRRERRR